MIRQALRLWRIMLLARAHPQARRSIQAAALAPVGTVEIVFRIWDAIW
jgi:hypothetical protein